MGSLVLLEMTTFLLATEQKRASGHSVLLECYPSTSTTSPSSIWVDTSVDCPGRRNFVPVLM